MSVEISRIGKTLLSAGLFFLLVLVTGDGGMTFGGEGVEADTIMDVASVQEKEWSNSVKTGEEPSGFIFEEPCPDLPGGSNGSGNGKAVDCTVRNKEQDALPRIAIIIDDMGHHQQMGEDLLGLNMNLTFSFLPHAPFTAEQETMAWKQGHDILVHMPMQPKDSQWDPGPGTLNLDDSAEELTLTIRENLNSVPHAIGANNHMGSSFTTDRLAMQLFLEQLGKKGLFFVDSLTTPDSVGVVEAGNMGIKTGRRQVFLDNVQTQEDICRQLKELVAYARKHGSAIGIGHPNRETYLALTRCRDLLLQQVRIVGVHELVQ